MTPKQQAFVREYLVDLNATQAAIRAGYSPRTAAQIGDENLRKPQIAAAVQAAMDERSKRIEITADRVLQEIAKVAFFDPRKLFDEDGNPRAVTELDDNTVAAIAGLEVSTEYEKDDNGDTASASITRVSKFKLTDRLKALELAGRHLKLFTDKVEHTGKDGKPIEVSDTDAAARLAAILAAAQARAGGK